MILILKSWMKLAIRFGRGQFQPRRNLNIHENLAYTLLKEAGVPIPPFGVAKDANQAAEVAKKLNSKNLVMKAQVLAGGRGKGKFKGTHIGGVVMCETPQEAKNIAQKMLGNLLITKQTGPAGRICNEVMLTTRIFARKEFYLGIMMERSFGGPVVISSSQGGVEIEEVAAKSPEAISYTPIDAQKGMTEDIACNVAEKLGVKGHEDAVAEIVKDLYTLFVETDALLIEINPLSLDIHDKLYALDCKCNFDDSAAFRQKDLFALRDLTQKAPSEVKADELGLNYIPLDGNIACMVNGAGLAMATMDLIKLSGGEPANFMDVGGFASVESVTQAFKIISSEPQVEAILVNIFGGIIRCDIIAQGMIAALKDLDINIPIVARLQGTNADIAKKLILETGLRIIPIDDMTKATEAAVTVAQICRLAKTLDLDIELSPKKGCK